ncbi:DUF349 [Candidatus Magnetomoraceae bacterium gMMP-15]
MKFMDYILPKWKNSNPEIRLQAVRNMDEDKIGLIESMAKTDPVASVRIEALNKINNEEILHNISLFDTDTKVRISAWNKLNSMYREMIFNASDTAARKEILDKIKDENVITSIGCEINDSDIRLAVVDRISTPEALCEIAENNCGFKAGMLIVEKLNDALFLERVANHASNKKIRKAAKTKQLDNLKNFNKPSPEENLENELERLCKITEDVVDFENWGQAASILIDAETAWKQSDPDESHDLIKRFNKARNKIKNKLNKIDEKNQTINSLQEICDRIENLSESPTNEAFKEVEQAKITWKNIDASILSDTKVKYLEKFFTLSCIKFDQTRRQFLKEKERHQHEIKELTNYCYQLEKLYETNDWDAAHNKLNKLKKDWDNKFFPSPDASVLKQRFEKAEEQFRQKYIEFQNNTKKQAADQQKRLYELCEEVEQAAQAEDRVGLDRKIKIVQQEWKRAGILVPEIKKELMPRFTQACDKFFEKQRGYWQDREWEMWANLTQKEELCAEIENPNSKNLKELADMIREAQVKWKEIGPVSKESSEEIWNRFKAACDRINDRCFAKKNELYLQVKDLGDSTDWKKTTEKIKAVQAEWKALGPLPLIIEKDLRESFQKVCSTFFENKRLFYQKQDEKRHKNLETRIRLCTRAEALKDSTDWNNTANEIKKMQREWKETGAVPRNEGEDLWPRFKSACNIFFENMDRTRPENLIKKESLCKEVEKLFLSINDETDLEKMRHKFINIQKKWKKIGPVPEEHSQRLWDHFNITCNEFFTMLERERERINNEQLKNQALKEALVTRVEELSKSTDWKITGEKIKAIQKEWKTIKPASQQAEKELWKKFNNACNLFFNQSREFFINLDKRRMEYLKLKKDLCLHLEILAKVAFPEKRLGYNKFIPVSEQLNISLEYKNKIIETDDYSAAIEKELNEIKTKWSEIGPVPDKNKNSLNKRYQKAMDLFKS